MASITKQSNGHRTIQFVASDGKRRSIRLGKVPQRVAEAIKFRVEQVNVAKIHGHAIDDDTARWLAGLDETLTDKLARVGLVPRRKRATLAAFLNSYISRNDVKAATVTVWGHTRRNLIEFFGPEKPLREITRGDADDWKQWLIGGENLGHNTITKQCQFANQFFRSA